MKGQHEERVKRAKQPHVGAISADYWGTGGGGQPTIQPRQLQHQRRIEEV